MKKLPVLILNSYAGGITVAAHQEGHKVIGSYEDAAYGLKIQKHNFPNLDYRPTVAEWPARQDLSGTLVLSNPPCAAFSKQVGSAGAHCRGCGAKKFGQTKLVLEYAMGNKAAALAIESVPGALEGAREVHDRLAAAHGYTVHRVFQNAASWVPQNRPRVWFIFLPMGQTLLMPPLPAGRPILSDIMLPAKAPARTHLPDVEHEPVYPWVLKAMEKQRDRLKTFHPRVRVRLLDGSKGVGLLAAVLRRHLLAKGVEAQELGTGYDVSKLYCENGAFTSSSLRLLSPDGLASTLIGTTWWVVNGRPLTALEYQRIMGFPDGYDMVGPGGISQHPSYLSRGVCPPVARWVLQGLQATVTRQRGTTGWHRCPAGEILDLRPSRAWLKGITEDEELVA
jgi:site-specific DNA-cytosine methylase